MENAVKIEKEFLLLRDEFKDILRKVRQKKSSKVSIDFSRVKFISRSFADELLNMIEQLKNKKD